MNSSRPPFRISLVLVLLPALFFLGGCSLFGIATKGNLEEAVAAQEAQNQQTASQLAEMSNDLSAIDTKLTDDLARIDGNVTQMRQTIVAAQQALQSIQFEMDSLALEVEQAGLKGERALVMHKDNLVTERARLRMRIQELDDQIDAWHQTMPAASTPPVTTQVPPRIVPEQPAVTENTEPAKSTSDETSVWDRQR